MWSFECIAVQVKERSDLHLQLNEAIRAVSCLQRRRGETTRKMMMITKTSQDRTTMKQNNDDKWRQRRRHEVMTSSFDSSATKNRECSHQFRWVSSEQRKAEVSGRGNAHRCSTLKSIRSRRLWLYMLDVLHWLPLYQRITYRIAALIWRCLLARAVLPIQGIRGRSSLTPRSGVLIVPFYRAFSVVGPSTWNWLPLALGLLPRVHSDTFSSTLFF